MSTAPRPIVVAGDLYVDHLVYAGHDRWPNSTLDLGTAAVDRPGSAALLADVLTHLLPGRPVALAANSGTVTQWPRAYAVFDRFPAEAGGKAAIWRMREPLGFERPPADTVAFRSESLPADTAVLVLDDAGLSFRRVTSEPAWPPALRDPVTPAPDWVVLKTHAPLAAGDLWHHLISDPRGLARRCVAVLACPDLRAEHVRVTQGLSWERAAVDLAGEFLRNPTLAALSRCRFAVVRFDTDGALVADFTRPAEPAFRLVFDPGHLEGDWAARVPGRVYGYHTVFAAAVAAALADLPADDPAARSAVERGVMDGLAAARRLALAGHGPADQAPAFPFAELAVELKAPTSTYSAATVPADDPDWSIAASDPAGQLRPVPLYGLARRVALNGTAALRGLPFQRFGKLFIVDRGEIESLRGLRRLVADYARPGPADRPLSIAVFGSPGSGKSFGVKELTRAVLGDQTPILEFNLAQFDGPAELLGLLHQVRDKVLEGRTPVVFWDEFDSKNLMWLQYLLAPMQDGRVQDGQLSHPIGKCVFVFAGGTSHEFAGFGAPPSGASEADRADCRKAFREAKGPDFVSRLNGYLNVLGPNPRQVGGKDDPADVSFPVRRALFLRAKLGLFGDERLHIDPGVLSAFLEVGRYAHGARSMEKVIDQARAAAGGGRVGRSHLPPRQLLDLHVDADEFRTLVERDLAFQYDVESMAQAYHEFYRDLARRRGWKSSFDVEYPELPEFMKADNRAAARRVCNVLGLIGLYVVPAGQAPPGSSPALVQQAMDQNLEVLAEGEHDGWVEARKRNNWVPAPVKNVARREQPLLVPYDELPTDEKEKDREAVRRYPEIVARAGYRIVTGPPPRHPAGSARQSPS